MTGNATPLDHPHHVAAGLAGIAHAIVAAGGPDQAFERVASSAVDLVPGCDHGSITVVQRGRFRTAGASDQVPVVVDEIQYETGEGPCLEVLGSGPVSVVDDLAQDPRWRPFADRVVAETPVRSLLSLRLEVDGRTVGALNLHGDRERAFDRRSLDLAELLASHAAVGLATSREIDQLRAALESRDVIATAKGILMARQGISDDEAFAVLCRASRRSNIKVRELASQLVARHHSGSGGAEGPAGLI